MAQATAKMSLAARPALAAQPIGRAPVKAAPAGRRSLQTLNAVKDVRSLPALAAPLRQPAQRLPPPTARRCPPPCRSSCPPCPPP